MNLWETEGCNGNPTWATSDHTNISLPEGTSALYYTINGLWNFEINSTTELLERSVRIGSGEGCTPWALSPGAVRLLATRYGDLNQSETTIYLFPSPNFDGDAVVVDQQGTNNIDIVVRSYYFTGPYTWEIDNGSETQCLNFHESVGTARYGFTYKINTELQINSVRFDCSFTPVTSTTTGTTDLSTTTGPSTTETDPGTTDPSTTDPTTTETDPGTTDRRTTDRETTDGGRKLGADKITYFLVVSAFIKLIF